MSDPDLRALERLVAAGDLSAVPALRAARERAGVKAPIYSSHSLYPSPSGEVVLCRSAGTGYRLIGEPWPTGPTTGDLVEVHDHGAWEWDAVLLEPPHGLPDDPRCRARVVGPRRALPLPAPSADGVVRLPRVYGHAHARGWSRGDVVREWGACWRVVRVAAPRGASHTDVTLAPASEEDYATRPGRVAMHSQREAAEAVGSAIEVDGEWVHVREVARTSYSGALGRDHTYWAVGRFVRADKAARINELHPRHLERDLAAAAGERVAEPMPDDAAQLVPRDRSSLAATGTRVAIEGAGRRATVLHERVGDPDMSDSWRHYVVRIADAALVARVRRYVAAAQRRSKGGVA